MQRYTQMRAWKHAHELMLRIYRETRSFPHHEQFGIQSQMRRAAVSVAVNIAEGSKRGSDRDFAHFLDIAHGSLAEVEALILASRDLEYLTKEVSDELLARTEEAARTIHGLRLACRKASNEAATA